MTREEQIRQASIEYTIKNRPMCIGGGAFSEVVDEMNRNHAFEKGAKWADETHGKELMYVIQKTGERTKKEFINKACDWLEKQVYQEYGGGPLERLVPDEVIEDFKKEMEGQL